MERWSQHAVLRHFTFDVLWGLWIFLLWLSITINVLVILAFGTDDTGSTAVIIGSDAILGNSHTATTIRALVRNGCQWFGVWR